VSLMQSITGHPVGLCYPVPIYEDVPDERWAYLVAPEAEAACGTNRALARCAVCTNYTGGADVCSSCSFYEAGGPAFFIQSRRHPADGFGWRTHSLFGHTSLASAVVSVRRMRETGIEARVIAVFK
jgi:hypothetical protein